MSQKKQIFKVKHVRCAADLAFALKQVFQTVLQLVFGGNPARGSGEQVVAPPPAPPPLDEWAV